MITLIKFYDASSETYICSAIIKSSMLNNEVKNILHDAFISFFEYAIFNDNDILKDAVEIVLNSFVKDGEFDFVYIFCNDSPEKIDIYL